MVTDIACFIDNECSSRRELLANLEQAIAKAGMASGSYRLIEPDEAVRLNLKGSPAVLINGIDIAPAQAATGSG